MNCALLMGCIAFFLTFMILIVSDKTFLAYDITKTKRFGQFVMLHTVIECLTKKNSCIIFLWYKDILQYVEAKCILYYYKLHGLQCHKILFGCSTECFLYYRPTCMSYLSCLSEWRELLLKMVISALHGY